MKIELEEPKSLLLAAKQLFPESSMRTLRNWIEQKRFEVDGKIVTRANSLLRKGQIVNTLSKTRAVKLGLRLLYLDDEIAVVDKPAGLLSVEAKKSEKHAHGLLKDYLEKIGQSRRTFVIHRLDEETSGVLVFARKTESFQKLKEALKRREIKRSYVALVEGFVESDQGLWSSYLKEGADGRVYPSSKEEDGMLAQTYYKVLKRNPKTTLLELNLKTGKKHQIRFHAQQAGHPVLGDKKYGSSHLAKGARLSLHAVRLKFDHPISNKPLEFHSPVPNGF